VVPSIKVVAGILQDAAGRVLISERLGDASFAGLWEFPGGKVGEDELPDSALRRELKEELDVSIECFEPLMQVDHSYPDRNVSIAFYLVTKWQSDPKGMEGQELRWQPPDRIDVEELLPADAPVVGVLKNRADTISKCLSET
jgi:8-oxo-dGTP diphosphatase